MRLSRAGLALVLGAAALVPAAAASAVTSGEVDASFTFVRPAPTGGNPWVNSMSVQADHKVVHLITSGTFPHYVRRALPSGGSDTTFGSSGRVDVDDHNRVLVLPDGKLLAFGGGGGATGDRAELLRLLPDGTVDPSFGSAGMVLLPAQAGYAIVRVKAVHPLPDGGLAVAGDAFEAPGNFDPFVAVLDADGTPRAGWRPGTAIAEPDGTTTVANTVHGVIPDGADGYYAIGQSFAGSSVVKAWHFTASGPITSTSVPSGNTVIAVAPGSAGEAFVMGGGFGANPRVYVLRLEATPTSIARDHAWGVDGYAPGISDLNLKTLVHQPDGRLAVFGYTTPADVSMTRDIISRFDAQGRLDPSFGTGGAVTLPHVSGARDVEGGSLAVAPDGRLLVGGAIAGSPTKPHITRLYGNIARTSTTASSTHSPGLVQTAAIDVLNAGPDVATDARLEVTVTGPFAGTLSTTRGTCSGTTSPWRCDLGDLPPGERVQVTAELAAAAVTSGTLTATVSTPTYDDVPGDQTATTTLIALPTTHAPVPPATTFTLEKRPRIKGKPVVGQRLKAKPGTWSPTPTKIRYQWLRNGKRIKKATQAKYRLVRKDRGKKVTVRVTVRRPGMDKASAQAKAKRVRRG